MAEVEPLLDLDALQLEFASCDQIHMNTSTLRALEFASIRLKIILTIIANEICPNPLKVECGPLCDGPFADDVPIELDRIADDGREIADDQIDASDALGVTRMPECDLEYVLCDREFVHLTLHHECLVSPGFPVVI